jgi:hypothetical protein
VIARTPPVRSPAAGPAWPRNGAGRQQRGNRGVQGGSRVRSQAEPASGVVEAFEESASESGEDLHLFRVPIVFG